MTCYVPLLSLLLFAIASTGFGLELSRISAPPRLDGRLDDAAWKNAAPIANFREDVFPAPTATGTWARIVYDDAYLYVAFSCPHAHPDMMKAEDDGVSYKVHYDEHIELALSPDQMGPRLFRLQINPRGVMQVTVHDKSDKANWDYGAFCRAATAISTNGWTLELAIPWLRVCATNEFQPDKLALNLARMMLANKVDQYGVFTGYESHKSSLSLDKPPGLKKPRNTIFMSFPIWII